MQYYFEYIFTLAIQQKNIIWSRKYLTWIFPFIALIRRTCWMGC